MGGTKGQNISPSQSIYSGALGVYSSTRQGQFKPHQRSSKNPRGAGLGAGFSIHSVDADLLSSEPVQYGLARRVAGEAALGAESATKVITLFESDGPICRFIIMN